MNASPAAMLRLMTGQPGRSRGSLSRSRAALSGALGVIAVNFALLGCADSSYERSSDGTTVYIDELSDAAKATARQRVVASLNRGIGVYSLGVGDEVEIYFHVNRAPTAKQYVILAGDKLRVDSWAIRRIAVTCRYNLMAGSHYP
jgi:hypothetical protein